MSSGTSPEGPPEEHGPRETEIAEALAEYHDLRASGRKIDAGDFCARYPRFAAELRAQLAELEGLGQTLEPGARLQPPAGAEDLPQTLSGCRILGQIGSGGMGRVLLAFDDRLGRKVAIKILGRRYRDNPQLRERFMQEARAMARLAHPNVAAVYSLGPDDEEPHFAMEYVEGGPLTEIAQALDLRHKVELMRKVALAVDFLHRHGVLHRDLKPANILVGTDLEPKVLDFGLALCAHDARRLTASGELVGTPAYFSPEQTEGGGQLEARSDVFSLGAVLYELLTGALPFPAESLAEQMRQIRQRDPVLPRRLNPAVSGDLQNVCLKALEKTPADRYASAHELAEDLARFLAGEPVIAQPVAYSRMMSGKIQQHLRELDAWKKDRILSDFEFQAFRKLYDRLTERDDAWIMEMRRLSLPQVTLYLGAWLLAVGAGLVLLFKYASLAGAPSVFTVALTAAATAWLGVYAWKRGRLRIAIAFLLAFCLLLPVAYLLGMTEWGLLTGFTKNRKGLEVFEWCCGAYSSAVGSIKQITNVQIWWALLLALPAYYWLRRFTRASVFSLVLAFMSMVFCLVTLLRLGLVDWLKDDRGLFYLHLLPVTALFFIAGATLEGFSYAGDSRYFYPFAVAFSFIALSGLAAEHQGYAAWLGRVLPFTRGAGSSGRAAQIEYLFLINAAIYRALQYLSERLPLAQMRRVAKTYRFVIPGHVLTSLLLLGLAASARWQEELADPSRRLETRAFEVALPIAACMFVFASISRQAKNYFATGLLFLAIGLIRLQQEWLKGRGIWPIALLATGIALMLLAANYSAVRIALRRRRRRS